MKCLEVYSKAMLQQAWESSWIPYFLDNRIIDGGKAVSALLPRKIPVTPFC
jgi:hypothetical protein